ncbi:MAG: protein PhnA [Saprospiraceae bacterium]|jgi:protein PhnA
MSILSALENRCESKCELCNAENELSTYTVPPKVGDKIDEQIALCAVCQEQVVEEKKDLDTNHWRCLNESMWSQVPAVQVMSYRMLNRLTTEAWSQDLIGMMYMDDATMEWAQALGAGSDSGVVHKDSNGNILQNGDTVTLIKDLDVKGASFTAKRGTAVRRISLVMDNPEHIQGRIKDQTIIILTKFVKK